jgi:hypothetical protein
VGRRRRENFGDSWEERSRLGEQSRARAETASEFGSRDGERGDDVSSRPLRFKRGEDSRRGKFDHAQLKMATGTNLLNFTNPNPYP